jgi:hypothetical protein
VRQELQAIADEMNNAQGAASLYNPAPVPLVVLTTTPQLIEFALSTPGRDFRAIVPDAAANAIYVRRPGLIGVSFTLTGLTPDTDNYRFQLFFNDVATALEATFDASNQTTGGTVTALGTFRVVGSVDRVADKLDIRGAISTGVADWTQIRGYFSVWWLGD